MSAQLLSRLTLAAAVAFLLFSIGCHQTRRSTNGSASRSESTPWDSYVNQFLESYFVAHPDFAVRAGRHEFDGKLPDWSADGLSREIKRLHEERDRVKDFDDSDLDGRQLLERDYLLSVIDADLFWLESAEWPFRCPQFYAEGIDPDVYVSREYASLDQRLRGYIAYARAIPTALDQIRKNLRTPLPKSYVNIWSYYIWRSRFVL